VPFPHITFCEPWRGLSGNPSAFEKELVLEVGRGHILFGRKMCAVANRQDNDDVLFVSDDVLPEIVAVVQLTWSSRTETNPRWPTTVLYDSVELWVEHGMMVDHDKSV
jgi:hypothetical protein